MFVEMTEARTTYQPERNWFRRADRAMCFMMFEGVRSPLAKKILGWACLPFVLIYLFGYCSIRSRIDTWRAGRPAPDGA
jgi:hypothetical protein